ncbi:MAG: NADP-dependent oxidoreductase [Chloroflexota bacterium]
MTNTMKAIRIHSYGSPDVLTYEDAPCPDPGTAEVLVRVYAVGINPVDWKTRAGGGVARRLHNPFPMIPGWDVSGVVEAIGPGVTDFKVGDEVFGMVRFPEVGAAYAEYVAAPIEHLAVKPHSVDHIQAAAIPLAALTAWQALFEHGTLTSGQRLLIHGAAGGVGHLAVQVAKWKGAEVIGTGSTANLDYLHTLGLDQIIDYTTTRFEDAINPVDMVLDTVGGEILSRSFNVLKDGGELITIAGTPKPPDPQQAEKRGLRASGMLVHTEASHLKQIAQLMSDGSLLANIAQVFPLTEAKQAHESGEHRSLRRGKIVLQVRA